jgi:hypothetical protein
VVEGQRLEAEVARVAVELGLEGADILDGAGGAREVADAVREIEVDPALGGAEREDRGGCAPRRDAVAGLRPRGGLLLAVQRSRRLRRR